MGRIADGPLMGGNKLDKEKAILGHCVILEDRLAHTCGLWRPTKSECNLLPIVLGSGKLPLARCNHMRCSGLHQLHQWM